MSPHETDRRHFERQLVFSRPIIIILALLAVFELAPSRQSSRSVSFLTVYLILSIVVILLEDFLQERDWHLPLAVDLLSLAFFIYVCPATVPIWFPYLYICYAAGSRWGFQFAVPVAGLAALSIVLVAAARSDMQWSRVISWLAATAATFAAGAGLAFLGERSRVFASQNEFLSNITATMHVDQGLAESIRLLLNELAISFQSPEAFLVFRDADLERIFVWRLKTGESERITPDTLPLARSDGFLLDDFDATLCWNSTEASGSSFGWDRRDGRVLKIVPRLPGPTQQQFAVKSFISVAFDQADRPVGRLFLINGRADGKPYTKDDLAWLERVARHIGPSLENLFLLRHLRARAIEAERHGHLFRFVHPWDVLVSKLQRLEEKDLEAFKLGIAKTGHPTEEEFTRHLQKAVDRQK